MISRLVVIVLLKKKGIQLSVKFKEPLNIDYDAPAEEISESIMNAIEQSKALMMQGPHHWLTTDK